MLTLILSATLIVSLSPEKEVAYASVNYENGALSLNSETEFLDSLGEDEDVEVFLTFDYVPYECDCEQSK